ncbi:MAG: carbohydrate ABC transporter substrate-binding protein, partial [Lachnospiraceae bacterium]|nr:carbohydrate ABC transporter substrate-binding protein [Lachnospiraceae bacterium]
MKKRWLALGLTAAMITSMAACGGSSTSAPAESKPAESAAATAESKPAESAAAATESKAAESKPAEAAGDEGKVLNVSVWNDEFINRVTDHYPGYEKVSDTE